MSEMLYLAGTECRELPGVRKKIENQILRFTNKGIHVELRFIRQNNRLKKICPFSSGHRFEIKGINRYDFLYIRWMPASYPAIRFLQVFKSVNTNAKVMLEIPTYPYEGELKAFSNALTRYRDKLYRIFLKKYVDRIIVYTEFEELFGIPALKLVNPIVVNHVPVPLRNRYRTDNRINLMAVASIEYYYGYDRLIRGLKNYERDIRNYEVHLHLVGDGGALQELKQLCTSLELDGCITFYGYRTGKELDEIYELADIGIDVLGGHRKDDFYFGSLKSREYMCKGLPFVTEYPLPESISEIRKYIYKVPADESDIEIPALVDFFLGIKKESRATTISNMRNFACSTCDISVAMEPVIEYLEE